ncbi:helix-turn-helix domain-containing protein [Planctomycetota bacterium]
MKKYSESLEYLLTAEELAERLRISVRSVYRYVEKGMLAPPARLGRLVRWRPRDVSEWLEISRSKKRY